MSNDNELSEKIYQAAAHNRCSVGNISTTRVVTVSCRQPYLPSAVQVARVVSGETRTEDDAAHFRQHPPTGSWQHRQQKSNIKVGVTTKTVIKVLVQVACVCVCVSVGECLPVYCIILQETVQLIQNFKILLHELISTSDTKGFELECGISKNTESQKSHTHSVTVVNGF